MSNKEILDFHEKLKQGLEIAEQRMLEEKALRNEDVIVSSDGKTIERIPARQLLWSLEYRITPFYENVLRDGIDLSRL